MDTWRCPDCGYEEDFATAAIAEIGVPYCPDCMKESNYVKEVGMEIVDYEEFIISNHGHRLKPIVDNYFRGVESVDENFFIPRPGGFGDILRERLGLRHMR